LRELSFRGGAGGFGAGCRGGVVSCGLNTADFGDSGRALRWWPPGVVAVAATVVAAVVGACVGMSCAWHCIGASLHGNCIVLMPLIICACEEQAAASGTIGCGIASMKPLFGGGEHRWPRPGGAPCGASASCFIEVRFASGGECAQCSGALWNCCPCGTG
jgi:hypothetical protein